MSGRKRKAWRTKIRAAFVFKERRPRRSRNKTPTSPVSIVFKGNCAAPRFHAHESRPITVGVSKLDSQKAFSVSRKDLSTNFKNVFIGFWRGFPSFVFQVAKSSHDTRRYFRSKKDEQMGRRWAECVWGGFPAGMLLANV